MDEIKAGAVVQLKSGSRPMTVTWVNRDQNCGDVWEDADGKHHTATYSAAALKAIKA